MRRFIEWILSRFIRDGETAASPAVRVRVGKLEGWTSIASNIILFLLKGWLGLMAGSVALVADAFHTLSDSATSLIVILGFRMVQKPADKEHPFGHGRVENIAAIVIGVLLGVVAVEILKASFERIRHPSLTHVENWVIVVVAVTILIKELMARFAFGLARRIESDALMADAQHHRSDALSTIPVVLALIGVHWNLPWLDGVMGIAVAALIGWSAYECLRDASGPLIGQPAPDVMIREIDRIALQVDGVLDVHDIAVHRYGATNVISLHIEVCATLTAMRLHEISDEVENRLARRFIGHAIVHADPVNTDYPHYAEVKRIVSETLAAEPRAAGFHDLRLIGGVERFKVVFDVTAQPNTKEFPLEELRRNVAQRLSEQFSGARVSIELEPPYFRSVGRKE